MNFTQNVHRSKRIYLREICKEPSSSVNQELSGEKAVKVSHHFHDTAVGRQISISNLSLLSTMKKAKKKTQKTPAHLKTAYY